jgi:hypothetical protein
MTLRALFLLLLLLPAGAPQADDGIPKTKRWHEPFVTLLDVDFVNTGFQARWEYFHCGCGDILVRMEQTAPDGVLTGEMLLIDGQVIAARGMVSLSPDLEPMLQPPSIMLHLAFALLEKGAPRGPARVTERQTLDAGSMQETLNLNSGMVTGTFKAPWRVEGEVWPSGDGQRRFEMQFEFANPLEGEPDNRTSFRFTGGQDYRRDDFPFPGSLSLEGWKVQWISKGEVVASDAPEGLTLEALREEALALSAPAAAE